MVEMVGPPVPRPGLRVALAGSSPVDELDGHLETGVAFAHPFVLDYPQIVEEDALKIGNGGLANAYPGDVRRFEHGDSDGPLQRFTQVGGCHPPSGAAPDDHDFLYLIVRHRSPMRYA